jgi:hypothetical protein
MKFIPDAIRRTITDQALLGRKHAPTILLGAGLASMVGSTVLACRATLKVEAVLDEIAADKNQAIQVKKYVEAGKASEETTYDDIDLRQDLSVIYTRGAVKVIRLYAPAVILGGVGVACLTKSHQILKERNLALTAAYIAVDTAFKTYRERVVDRYGEETDRELRYDSEEVDIVDDETGKLVSTTKIVEGDHGMYARWFDEENTNWSAPPLDEYNWIFLRGQQNWCNDMLMSRGHLFLNEAYGVLGLAHTSAGSVVGWVYDRNNEVGDNYVDFGCFDPKTNRPLEFFNGREGAILLDFNVDGPIWQLIDERREQQS